MDEILSETKCKYLKARIRKNWLLEMDIDNPQSVSTFLVLNCMNVEDFRKLSEMFAKAADYFEKEQE